MSGAKNSGQSPGINPWPWICVLAIAVLGVLGNYFLKFHGPLADEPDTWGQFGDYVGGILNPLLSFCAFVGLLFTLKGQHSDGLKAEARHKTQLDDARFFQLLNLISSSSENFLYSPGTKGDKRFFHDGRVGIEQMWSHFSSGLIAAAMEPAKPLNLFDGMKKSFNSWKGHHWSLIGPHFQLIHASIEFIAKAGDPRGPEVRLYMSLLKAKLSEEERLMSFYLALISKEQIKVAVVMIATGFDQTSVVVDPLTSKRLLILEAGLLAYNLDESNLFS